MADEKKQWKLEGRNGRWRVGVVLTPGEALFIRGLLERADESTGLRQHSELAAKFPAHLREGEPIFDEEK